MKLYSILCFLFLFNVIAGSSYTERNILKKACDEVDFFNIIITDDSWIDFPSYYDRVFWNSIPLELAKKYIASAEDYLTYKWTAIKATDYLEFVRSGDRRQEVFNAPKSALISLVMGELVEGQGRFIDQIINGVWFYSEQTWWGWSAHIYLQKEFPGLPDSNDHTIDLNVGDMANILSWTWYFFHEEFDKIHPLISIRLKDEIRKKAIDPYLERTDFWWMGIEDQSHINNWNPWINYNMLNCILLMEEDPERKILGIQKIIQSLDVFLNSYPDDGGCNEGSSYWGAAGGRFFESLHMLKKISGGKLDVYDNPLVQNIGKYIYKVYIHLPYFINFADADPQITSIPLLIYLYGKAIQDPVMKKFGAFLAQNIGWGNHPFGGTLDRHLLSLMYRDEILHGEAEEPLIGSCWLPETEVAAARDKEGTFKGFFFAAKGGFNAESHNHNDAGSCVLYYNGNPFLIDVGRETYTAKTFSRDRYSIWTMQSQYHNLPKINGIDQMNGEKYKAVGTTFRNTGSKTVFSTEISGAYPKEAQVEKWDRTYTLQKGKYFEILDEYKLARLTDQPTSLNFMTNSTVIIEKPGTLRLNSMGETLKMLYDPDALNPSIENIIINDKKLQQYWPDGLTRIILTLKDPGLRGKVIVRISEY